MVRVSFGARVRVRVGARVRVRVGARVRVRKSEDFPKCEPNFSPSRIVLGARFRPRGVHRT